MDAMCVETFDPKTGERFPPYYAFNFEGHLPPGKKSTADEPNPDTNAIIYDLKANASNDSPIHSNAYSRINGGNVAFLAAESVIKSKLMATRKGQKMTQFDKRVFLLPYEMTSRLIDEMNNLKLKPTGAANQIKVEQISKQINKDRWSSSNAFAAWRFVLEPSMEGCSRKYAVANGERTLVKWSPIPCQTKCFGALKV